MTDGKGLVISCTIELDEDGDLKGIDFLKACPLSALDLASVFSQLSQAFIDAERNDGGESVH
jgi:hypothetical protein